MKNWDMDNPKSFVMVERPKKFVGTIRTNIDLISNNSVHFVRMNVGEDIDEWSGNHQHYKHVDFCETNLQKIRVLLWKWCDTL